MEYIEHTKKTVYFNDGYFQNILENIFKQLGWSIIANDNNNKNKIKKIDRENIVMANPVTFYHANFSQCINCQYTNGLADSSPLGDKVKIHQTLNGLNSLKKPLDFVFPSYTINQNRAYTLETIFDGKTYWIIKPSNSLRQQGIKITNNFTDFVVHLSQNTNYQEWLVQKYLDKPMLYRGYKCHFRCYGLIKIVNNPEHRFECYIYPKGYIYVADKPFRLSNFDDSEIHLTTSCNNKEFPKEYNAIYGNGQYSFENFIFPQMKKIVYHTVKNVADKLNCPNQSVEKSCCYKLIAYDLIADQSGHLYLMEINARVIGMSSTDLAGNCKSKTPSLQTPEFKSELMTDIINTVIYDKPKLFVRIL